MECNLLAGAGLSLPLGPKLEYWYHGATFKPILVAWEHIHVQSVTSAESSMLQP